MNHRQNLNDERAAVEAGQRLTRPQGRDLLARYDEQQRAMDALWKKYAHELRVRACILAALERGEAITAAMIELWDSQP